MSGHWRFLRGIWCEVTLEQHFALMLEERESSREAPLSVRKLLLVAVLLDHFADRVFVHYRTSMPDFLNGATDVLAWRGQLVERSAALAAIFALCSGQADGATLRLDAVALPSDAYASMAVEEFMVSVYNDNRVQQLVMVAPDGSTAPAHAIMDAALAFWEESGWRKGVR